MTVRRRKLCAVADARKCVAARLLSPRMQCTHTLVYHITVSLCRIASASAAIQGQYHPIWGHIPPHRRRYLKRQELRPHLQV